MSLSASTDTIAAAAAVTRKRPRPPCSESLFLDLKKWILQQHRPGGGGGAFFVHPKVDMRTEDRSLVVTNGGIQKGATVFTIPVVGRAEIPREETEPSSSTTLSSTGGDDAELAWYLAQRPLELKPYLDSLPETIDLPRFWSKDQLHQLLKGSPVLAHIRHQQETLQRDYDERRAVSSNQNSSTIIPSMEDFSYAMAAVKSRAFCLPTTTSSVMVPLLDLCNHHRGGSSRKKNLSYTFQQRITNQEEGGTTNDIATTNVVVQVQAATDIAPGECLRITYGAQGNAQLLMNYGFCLQHNLEPDGSSNDTLEFSSSAATASNGGGGAPDIFLRTGPKAYTYGNFVKALEFCSQQEQQRTNGGVAGNDDVDDDMEAFLNECDAEEDKYDDDDDEEEEEEEDGGGCLLLEASGAEEKTDEESQRFELEALARFRTSLLERARAYNLQQGDIEKILEMVEINPTPEFYAALLIKSELRIIQFYLSAIDGLEKQLGQKQKEKSALLVRLEPSDSALIEKQVEELVAAYMQIRHSDFLDAVSQS